MNGLQCRPFFFCPAKQFSENWPKSVFEIVVRVERKKIPMVLSSLTACTLKKYRCRPTWTGPPTPAPDASTAAPTLPWSISEPRSWSCVTGKTSIRSTCSTAAPAASPSASIGRRKRGKPSWTRKPMPLPPRDYLPSLLSLKPARRSCARPSEKSLTRQAALTNFLPCCCNRA